MCAPGPPAELPDLQHLLPVKQLPTHRKREKGITKGFMWSISTHKLQSVAAACAVAARASTAITGASSVVASARILQNTRTGGAARIRAPGMPDRGDSRTMNVQTVTGAKL